MDKLKEKNVSSDHQRKEQEKKNFASVARCYTTEKRSNIEELIRSIKKPITLKNPELRRARP